MLRYFLLLITLSTACIANDNLPTTPLNSFDAAKKALYEKVYKNPSERKDFYCGCSYDDKEKTDLKSCGYQVRKNQTRAERIEAEHVFPAHQFGNFLTCWREPEKVCGTGFTGRACCNKTDPKFEMAHNDLHNLFPANGEVNGDRSNYNWGMVEGQAGEYGRCAMKIDESIRRAEPPDNVKGDVARAMFYMAATYGFNLSRQDTQLFTAWDKQDPVSEWEKERDRRIAAIQGNHNPFIANATVSTPPVKPTVVTPPPLPVKPVHTESTFSCTPKKTCGEMESCAEAKYQLNECGNSKIDGNNDGVPCEKLCK